MLSTRLALSSTFFRIVALFIAVISTTVMPAQPGDHVVEGGSVLAPPNTPAPLERTSVPFDVTKIEASAYKLYTMRKKRIGAGTGFLVSGKRTLVTTYHVIARRRNSIQRSGGTPFVPADPRSNRP